MGDGGAEGSSAIGDRGRAEISLTPDGSGADSDSLLDSILSTLLAQMVKNPPAVQEAWV